jgi:DNA-binding CsgD family transcriptional regulator
MTTIRFPDLVADAFESAYDVNGLVTFVRHAANYFVAQKAGVAIWSGKFPEPFLPVAHGMTGTDLQAIFDQRGDAHTLFGRLGKLSSGETLVSGPQARKFPAGTLPHETDGMHLLAGIIIDDDDTHFAIVLARVKHTGPFKQGERAALQDLLIYCQRAVDLNKHVTRLFIEKKAAFAALEYAPRGIIFLGQNGQVTYQNSAARMFLDKKDGMRLHKGSVRLTDPTARKKFDEFIGVAGSATGIDGADSLICKIPRQTMAAPFQLIVTKPRSDTQRAILNDRETLAIAIIHNPDDLVDLSAKYLRTFYELSGAEARLAQALYKYNTVTKAAASLKISVNTARSELKNVFKKVGVKTQSALLVEFAKALKEV